MFQRLVLRAIERYQQRGGGAEIFRVECNFQPSCSEYTRQAVMHFGTMRGLWLGFGRIRRCTDRNACGQVHDPFLPEE
ncbi:MAG TPA: membrane protein insertion efficiency factor YidD [Gammaproteobacteria bacterium]